MLPLHMYIGSSTGKRVACESRGGDTLQAGRRAHARTQQTGTGLAGSSRGGQKVGRRGMTSMAQYYATLDGGSIWATFGALQVRMWRMVRHDELGVGLWSSSAEVTALVLPTVYYLSTGQGKAGRGKANKPVSYPLPLQLHRAVPPSIRRSSRSLHFDDGPVESASYTRAGVIRYALVRTLHHPCAHAAYPLHCATSRAHCPKLSYGLRSRYDRRAQTSCPLRPSGPSTEMILVQTTRPASVGQWKRGRENGTLAVCALGPCHAGTQLRSALSQRLAARLPAT
ncbi:hypothetical protein LZ30DRAFT_771952 [Colletotrichum cereale]|nr:hypothetical protein LZ30DRAFT_771952 [Colletotrichum cereale]